MIKRKICVVTGARADYGLMKWLDGDISGDPELAKEQINTAEVVGADLFKFQIFRAERIAAPSAHYLITNIERQI